MGAQVACGGGGGLAPQAGEAQSVASATAVPGGIEVTRISGDALVTLATRAGSGPGGGAQSYAEAIEEGPQGLDPALAYDPATVQLIRNVLETLVYPMPRRAGEFIPLLATEWRVSADGRTYTFFIRGDATFSNGNDLTAGDVAYSLQRMLLVAPPDSPQHVLLEPLLGLNAGDLTATIAGGPYGGDRQALIDRAPARELTATCRRVQEAVDADDSEGTLTIRLQEAWAPLLAALSRPWASIVDRQWAVQRGAWDGRCDTWYHWHALTGEESKLATGILGTGPFVLDHWAPGTEFVLVANERYWRKDEVPMWDEGPAGPPSLSSVRVEQVTEPNLRWEMLRDASVESAALSSAGQILADLQVGAVCDWQSVRCQATETPLAPLRKYTHLPLWQQQALFFNFDIVVEDNAFVGSGRLDGSGIPPDFFADSHVRRAFATCLDRQELLMVGLNGNGFVPAGLIPDFIMAGVEEPGAYSYDLRTCGEELLQAWDRMLPSTGFRLQIPFESGNQLQQATAILLRNGLEAVSPAYEIQVVGLPPSLYRQHLLQRRLPLAVMEWTPALPDPNAWVEPVFAGQFAIFQQLPQEMRRQVRELLLRGRSTNEQAQRRQVFRAFSRLRHDDLPFLLLPQPAASLYQRRTVGDWIYNPADPVPYYYAYAMNEPR